MSASDSGWPIDHEAEELVALVDRFKSMTAEERVALATGEALSEQEQLALSVFAEEEPELAGALLSRPDVTDAAAGMADRARRASRPWWSHLSPRLDGWAAKSIWRAPLLAGVLTVASLAIAIFPDAFDDGGRWPSSRTGTRVMGIVGVVLFGTMGLVLVVNDLRSRRRSRD